MEYKGIERSTAEYDGIQKHNKGMHNVMTTKECTGILRDTKEY